MKRGEPHGNAVPDGREERETAIRRILEAGLVGTPEDLGSDYEPTAQFLDMMLDAAPQPQHIVELLAHGTPNADMDRLQHVAEQILAWHADHPVRPSP